jgi:hypothetical protein
MASFEGESTRVIDKFNGENFSLWKFKMEMVLASMDLWEIWTGLRMLHHPMRTPKSSRGTKGV